MNNSTLPSSSALGWGLQVGADVMTKLLNRRLEVIEIVNRAGGIPTTAERVLLPPGAGELTERLATLEHRVEQVEARLQDRGEQPGPHAPAAVSVEESLARIADALAPKKGNIVGTRYVADRLGCTTTWIAELLRKAEIPRHCVVPGTGKGKPWKFYRDRIDRWIESR
jgi:hypothetical protein